MKPEYVGQYAAFERNHWWFRARRVVLRALLDRQIPWRDGMSVLEIGVGSGENLYALYPDGLRLAGLDADPHMVETARRRGSVPVHLGRIEELPEPIAAARFDVITLFDVLEHIEDDAAALGILRGRLQPEGCLALTVPACPWMWGPQDEVNEHRRRYTRADLAAKLRAQGFALRHVTYFNTLLFPPIAILRLLSRCRRRSVRAESDFRYGLGVAERALYRIFAAEAPLLRRFSFPFGVSLFAAARTQARTAGGSA